MDKKYYIALCGEELRMVFTNEDLDFFESVRNTRDPFVIFSGNIQSEIITDIYVCELTNQGLIYRKRLTRELEEVDL